MIEIRLDIWEWTLVDKLARARHDVAVKSGYFREPANGVDPIHNDYLGVAGEFAFYKLVDRFPIISQDRRLAGTPDITIGGYQADIKGTELDSNGLMVSTDAKHHFDLYILMAVHDPTVCYIGYFFGEALFRDDRIYYPKPKNGIERKPFYSVQQNELFTDAFWIVPELTMR